MLYAFGLGPYLPPFATARHAATLMEFGGAEFITHLGLVIAEPTNSFAWEIRGIDLDQARSALGFYSSGDVNRCGYTNWELLKFAGEEGLHARTTWWCGQNEIVNPLIGWP